MGDRGTERLRAELRDYYGTAMFNGNPMAMMELEEVERASASELREIAQRNGFEVPSYEVSSSASSAGFVSSASRAASTCKVHVSVSKHADQGIDETMEQLEDRLSDAESRFESDGRMLEIKSSYSSCNDLAVLGDIMAESRRITDALYASYESLIRAADRLCKPWADEGASPESLRRVVRFMQHINSECSTLGSNYSVSVDSYSFGNMASTRYSPSSEARMIEANWELLYSMHPQVMEEKRRKEEAEAKARAEREERERIEREKAIEEYPQKLAEWETENARVTKLREELISQAQEEARREHRAQAERNRRKELERLKADRNQLSSRMDGALATIAAARFFEFGKKVEANQIIQKTGPLLAQAEQALQELSLRPLEEDEGYERDLERALRRAKEKVESEHPLPRKPQDPNNPRGSYRDMGSMTATQIVNESLKDALYETLESGGLMALSEIMEECPACMDLTNQRVSALLRQMIGEGRIERVEDKRKAYFRVAD